MLSRLVKLFFIHLIDHSRDTLSYSRAKKLALSSTGIEESNFRLIILELISCSHHAERFLAHMFGKMVPRKQLKSHIWILHTISLSLKKKKEQLRTKQTGSSTHVPALTSLLWTRLRLRDNTDSIFTKVVWSLETSSELLILKELILKPVAVLTVIALQK